MNKIWHKTTENPPKNKSIVFKHAICPDCYRVGRFRTEYFNDRDVWVVDKEDSVFYSIDKLAENYPYYMIIPDFGCEMN